jgi:DNA-3-methyladenine glycosylase I
MKRNVFSAKAATHNLRLPQKISAVAVEAIRDGTICRMTKDQPDKPRCPWPTDELYCRYHDEEWGVPVHDDRLLFEYLILEGAQAGLSWHTVLKKRENYRAAFDQFDAEKIARYGDQNVAALLTNAGIIRNRLKIHATIQNARACLKVQAEFGSLDTYLWRFVDGRPVINHRRSMKEVPAQTKLSDALSKDLLQRGFKFVGSTICQAHMQAVGMVNDHLVTCFRHPELAR